MSAARVSAGETMVVRVPALNLELIAYRDAPGALQMAPVTDLPAAGLKAGQALPPRASSSSWRPWRASRTACRPERSVDHDRDRGRDGHVPGRVVRAGGQGVASRSDLREPPRE